MPFKTYLIRLRNLISINIFFTTKNQFFFIIVKRKPKTNRLKKPFKNSDFKEHPIIKNTYFVEHLWTTASDGGERDNSEKDDEL